MLDLWIRHMNSRSVFFSKQKTYQNYSFQILFEVKMCAYSIRFVCKFRCLFVCEIWIEKGGKSILISDTLMDNVQNLHNETSHLIGQHSAVQLRAWACFKWPYSLPYGHFLLVPHCSRQLYRCPRIQLHDNKIQSVVSNS